MHGGSRRNLAPAKICIGLLLGGAILLMIPGGDEAFSQSAIRPQVPLYTVIDLHPAGFGISEGWGVSGEQQVGTGYTGESLDQPRMHALLWRGSPASVVDLSPSGWTEATAVCRGQQVGWGTMDNHALLWRGSAASMVDLNPSGVDASEALGTSGTEQVGWAVVRPPGTCNTRCSGAAARRAWWTSTPRALPLLRLAAPQVGSR